MDVAEPFAETLQPRRERSLVGWWLFTIPVSFARVAGHAFDTREGSGEIVTVSAAPRPRGPY
jgi:hypothetical protein